MACMSRAGREPGFKKQNQDNCFAFEKYITNEQSLFGAFDGHGPNGVHLLHLLRLSVTLSGVFDVGPLFLHLWCLHSTVL